MFVPCDSRRGLCNFTPEELRYQIHRALLTYYFTPRYLFSQFIRSIFVYHNFRIFKAGLILLLKQKEESVLAKR